MAEYVREGELTKIGEYPDAIPEDILTPPENQFLKYQEAEHLPPVLGLRDTYYTIRYKVVFEDKYYCYGM